MELSALPVNLLFCTLAAVLAVPGARKLGLGSVPGYLLAGVVVGPWGLALIRDAEQINELAQIGTVFVFFLAGLELRPELLIRVWRRMVLLGGLQMLLTAFGVYIIAILFQRTWYEALLVSLALSLSSQSVAMQFLEERNLFVTPAGQSIYPILLFQSIAVVPLMVLEPVLGFGNPVVERGSLTGFFETMLIAGVVLGCGHYILQHGYRYVTSLGSHEMFMGATILLVLTVVLIMQSFGQPVGLGVFLCGVLLAASEFFRKIDTDIEPYRGIGLGLFFVAVGMTADFGILLQRPSEILGLILVLLLLKSCVLYFVSRVAGVPLQERPVTSLLLAQSGEFSFIVLSLGATYYVIPERLAAMLTLVVMVSMLMTPLLMVWIDRHLVSNEIRRRKSGKLAIADNVRQSTKAPVVIAGFGRYGQVIARMLRSSDIEFVVIDQDPVHLATLQDLGFRMLFGDARRPRLLDMAGAKDAKVLVIAVNDREHALEISQLVSARYPNLSVVARAWDRLHHWQLTKQGAKRVQRETFESAILSTEDVLELLGLEFDEVERLSEAFRDHDERLLRELGPTEETGQKLMQIAHAHAAASREELLRLIDEDGDQKALEQELKSDDADRAGLSDTGPDVIN